MAKVKERFGKVGMWESYTEGNFFTSPTEESGDLYGTLLDFTDVEYKGKLYSGTFNPADENGLNINPSHVAAFKGMLENPLAASLSTANTAASKNASGNPFFNEYFSYYLGLAEERQKNLGKSLQRKDLLSTGSLL